MSGRLTQWLRTLSAPRRGLPVLLSLALIAAAVGLADIGGVLQRTDRIDVTTLLLTPAFAAIYLGFKGWQFGRLLVASGLESRWRPRWLGFAIGEMSLTLPFGMYSQNYVLKKAEDIPFADSAASTTIMLAFEVGFLLLVLAVLPVPGWPQMRPILWGIIGAATLLILLVRRSGHLRARVRHHAAGRGRLAAIAQGLLEFAARLRAIGHPPVLLRNGLITIFYMLALMFAFQHVGSSVSQAQIGFREALTIYSFGLLIAMSLGSVLSQFGVLELSAAAAAQAWGLDLHEALAMLIWFRLLWTASIWALCGTIVLALWRELRRLGA